MNYSSEIFREYDIRGIFNEQFDLDFAKALGQAYNTLARKLLKKENDVLNIAVGYDARESSPSIAKQITEGLSSCGVQVHNMGLVTSPLTYFATFHLDHIDGALMITGSHNPPEYNGFKISVGPRTIHGGEIQELRQIIENENYNLRDGGNETQLDIFAPYVEKYSEEFKEITNIPIVLDCGNGAAGCVVSRLFQSVGLKPEILFEEPDGRFPNHHPDPTVEKNLKDLKKRVQETQSVAGIGFDGDADRIGVVDHQGNVVLGDELMMIFARDILSQSPGATIVGDVKCSDRLYDEIERIGGKPIMWKTGHSLVKEKIKSEKAPFGGELSGHIFFNDRNYGYDDALYAALRLVEILAKTKKTIPELLEGIPKSFSTPEIRIDTTEEKKLSIVEKLRDNYKDRSDLKVNLIDGIRITFPEGWALARSSNTQPVLVLRFESMTESGLNEIRQTIESDIKEIENNL